MGSVSVDVREDHDANDPCLNGTIAILFAIAFVAFIAIY